MTSTRSVRLSLDNKFELLQQLRNHFPTDYQYTYTMNGQLVESKIVKSRFVLKTFENNDGWWYLFALDDKNDIQWGFFFVNEKTTARKRNPVFLFTDEGILIHFELKTRDRLEYKLEKIKEK